MFISGRPSTTPLLLLLLLLLLLSPPFASRPSAEPWSGQRRSETDIIGIVSSVGRDTQSAWIGHAHFAAWLAARMRPNVVVDLGVDKGMSTFTFASPGFGRVYGVDSFVMAEAGSLMALTGFNEAYAEVEANRRMLQDRWDMDNVAIMPTTFDKVASTLINWRWGVDILHVDGAHAFADAKRDYDSFRPTLAQSGRLSVVLFHDVHVPAFIDVGDPEPGNVGVRRFFLEGLDEPGIRKMMFNHSAGLGVALIPPAAGAAGGDGGECIKRDHGAACSDDDGSDRSGVSAALWRDILQWVERNADVLAQAPQWPPESLGQVHRRVRGTERVTLWGD